ncbi:DUF2188 domain-containing protein [uncultured Sphingobium sp.]|uniref:DUF2188 domain-containing protein n=1 Tax=uncultured Sphingobium sp. TaxID=316087 RepID=UPI00261F992A|nr:DUF2188 domain-containing protein [uncultured Sphingobium sp.]
MHILPLEKQKRRPRLDRLKATAFAAGIDNALRLYSGLEVVHMSRKGQHVVPTERGWSVKKAGSAKSTSVHATQAEAIAAATLIARNQKTELYIHGRDGRIRERNSYGSDPHPPKG